MEQNRRLIILLLFVLSSCINHNQHEENKDEFWSRQTSKLVVQYAKGFEIQYHESYTLLITKSIEGNAPFRDSLYLLHEKTTLPKEAKVLQPGELTLACQSSTHLSFINYLNQMQCVKGVCGLQYIQNEAINNHLKENEAKEICLGEALQMEALLTISPDLYLIYPFSAEEKENIEKNGVKTFMIAEYLETDPLARVEWIKLFGILFNKTEQAAQYFDKVVLSYSQNKIEDQTAKHDFFMNLPFGESWHAPSKSSLIVQLCENAGLHYYFQNESGTENITHSKEEMWEIGGEIPYWVIIASRPEGFSMSDLKAEEEVYKTFKSVKENQVIFCNTATSNYFTDGVIEPHVMLSELKAAINGASIEQTKYFQLLK